MRERATQEEADRSCKKKVSILGPCLWIVAYDSFQRIDMLDETRFVGYADDIAVLMNSM